MYVYYKDIYIILTGEARPYLLFANQNDIRFVEVTPHNFNPKKSTIVVKKLDDVAALDFFLTKNQVCWTEISSAVIRCSEINPDKKGKVDKEIIVNTGLLKPEGLACDWVNDNIYWTDSETKRIEVSSMPGKNGSFFHR